MTGAHREHCRRDLIEFALVAYRGFRAGSHLRRLARAIERLERGDIRRLAVFMPPRHGKSTLVSQILPVWYLGRHPDREVMICSYAASLAHRHNRAARRIATEAASAEIFSLSLGRAGSNRQAEWEPLVRSRLLGGACRSAGVGGGITGQGFSLGVIDDPVKNAAEALSGTYREKVWDWYQSAFLTRQSPDARILMTLTRWHEDDLAGRALREEPGEWEVLSLPAILPDGSPLWPERFDLDWVERQRRAVGSRWFSALYQQTPPAEVTGVFRPDWFRRFLYADGCYVLPDGGRVPAGFCQIRVIVDLAASEKKSADNTAAGVVAETPCGHLLILRMYAAQPGVVEVVPWLAGICREWLPEWVGIEADGFQGAIVSQVRRTPGFPPVRLLTHAGKSKLVRATPAAILAEQGNVLLPDTLDSPDEEGEWVRPLLEELAAFTGDGSGRDDRVDVLAYSVQTMVRKPGMPTLENQPPITRPTPRPKKGGFYGRSR